jgi:hypothetical protein
MITNDKRSTFCHGKSNIQQEGSLHQQKGLKYKKFVTFYIWSTALHDAEPWTLQKLD